MTIYIGSDHRGFWLKSKLVEFLRNNGFDAKDVGNFEYDQKDDYPDIAKKSVKFILKNKNSRGILICGSGAGVCIAANRLRKIRAVETHDSRIAKASRRDDDTNILCLGADFIEEKEAQKVVLDWLGEKFEKTERRVRRIKKLDKIPNS